MPLDSSDGFLATPYGPTEASSSSDPPPSGPRQWTPANQKRKRRLHDTRPRNEKRRRRSLSTRDFPFDKILDSRENKGRFEYRVAWDWSVIRAKDVYNCPTNCILLRDYHDADPENRGQFDETIYRGHRYWLVTQVGSHKEDEYGRVRTGFCGRQLGSRGVTSRTMRSWPSIRPSP